MRFFPVKDDVRGTIHVDAAPREMTVSEHFEFYREVFCGKGFSDDDATLAALATMDEYAYLYPTLYYAGRAEELIRFTQLVNYSAIELPSIYVSSLHVETELP